MDKQTKNAPIIAHLYSNAKMIRGDGSIARLVEDNNKIKAVLLFSFAYVHIQANQFKRCTETLHFTPPAKNVNKSIFQLR